VRSISGRHGRGRERDRNFSPREQLRRQRQLVLRGLGESFRSRGRLEENRTSRAVPRSIYEARCRYERRRYVIINSGFGLGMQARRYIAGRGWATTIQGGADMPALDNDPIGVRRDAQSRPWEMGFHCDLGSRQRSQATAGLSGRCHHGLEHA